MKARFKAIKEHFETEAKRFDKVFFKIAPFYKEAIEALVLTLPFENSKKPKIIDLGCGTGNITKAVKERYPAARVVCLDMAQNMIDMAKAKLKGHKDVEYWVGDICKYDYSNKPDAVISSLVLHHLDKKNKKLFYRKIFNALPRGGVFYSADFVLPSSDYLAKAYIEKWKRFMRKSFSPAQINDILTKHKDEDRPAELIFEIDLLRKTGFSDVEVVWKNYNFAVYGGIK
ncbi:MAG: class I SAM-dependent methyltransferase [Candidatus Omnitrophica bacterium]|nr:class I SAM-dependent methyltransferase [Candidatus Omnitrophota bacterium]